MTSLEVGDTVEPSNSVFGSFIGEIKEIIYDKFRRDPNEKTAKVAIYHRVHWKNTFERDKLRPDIPDDFYDLHFENELRRI